MTLPRTLKLYKLPDQAATPGLRPLRAADVPQVRKRPRIFPCTSQNAKFQQ
jgi:hypothetical protein